MATSTTIVVSTEPIDAQALAHACGAGVEWVVQLVEVGIVEVHGPVPARARPEDWRFGGEALQWAMEARRLERDFEVGLDAAALIIDLQREVRRLKALLGRQV